MEPQTLATAGGGCGEQTGPGYPTWGAWKAELPLQPTPRCSRRPSGLLEELTVLYCIYLGREQKSDSGIPKGKDRAFLLQLFF